MFKASMSWLSQAQTFLLQAFAKQEVQTAIMDCTQNPMNIINYQNNPEVMMVSLVQ